jgi:predicted nucleic acid-binding protein
MTAIDTNVLVYACDSADEFKQSRALEVIGKTEDGILLWQVACEFIAASRKPSKQGFTAMHAWARLNEFRDLLPLVRPSAEVLFEDESCILNMAYRSGMHCSWPRASIVGHKF